MSFIELITCVALTAAIVSVITLSLNRKKVDDIRSNEDILNLIRKGEHLKAIKAYRQLHGSNLKEAKAFVDINCSKSQGD